MRDTCGRRREPGQSLMEMVLLVTLVTTALVFMSVHVKRTSQGLMRSAADQLGDQSGAEQDFSQSFLQNSATVSRATATTAYRSVGGVISSNSAERTEMLSNSLVNTGFM